jgi:hypothetical protein
MSAHASPTIPTSLPRSRRLSHDPDVERWILGEHSPTVTGVPNLAGWKLFHCFSLLPLAVAFHGLHRFIVPQIKRAAPRRREEAYICNPLAYSRSMSTEVNQGVVADTAKLMMHRLIARQIRRDPTLVEKAKVAHAQP